MKTFEGKIISDKMNKAAVVEINFVRVHPLYKKRMNLKRKLHVQNEVGAKAGDRVRVVECRPISKTISYKIMEVLK